MKDKDFDLYLKKVFEQYGSLKKFKEGQCLCSFEYISGNVFLIQKGVARLLGKINNKITTIEKIGPGALIGALSLLRAEPSEEIRASEELFVWQISDSKFHELYTSSEYLRNYLNNYLFTSEVYLLIKEIYKESYIRTDISDVSEIYDLKKNIFIVENSENSIKLNLRKKNIIFVNSNFDELNLYKKINTILDWVRIQNQKFLFPPRFISIPENILDNLTKFNANINVDKIKKIDEKNKIEENFQNSKSVLFGKYFDKDFLEKGFDDESKIFACLKMLSKILDFPLKKNIVEKMLKNNFILQSPNSLLYFAQILTSMGLQVSNLSINKINLLRLNLPSLFIYHDELVIIIDSNKEGLKLASPTKGIIFLKESEIKKKFPDFVNILFVERNKNTQRNNFDIGWFLPAISKYKGIFIQIFITGIFIQLFSLANPLLIQVIIDKVISQRSLDTLQILGVALTGIILFEGILSSLKTFLLVETTNRLDQSLGARVIDHLLKLPLAYFDKRSVGELSSRINELEKIRTFITGTSLTTILDAIFSIVYLGVMIFYSLKLTIISLLVLPLQIIITILGAPLFKRQYRETAEENSRTQGHLVEILTGINSVKSQNIEMVSRWKWQKLYSKYIKKSFKKTITSTSLKQITQVLQKFSQLLVLWVGASMVLKAELSLGQLIAFRIISSYVTQPFLRLSVIWQNIQELKISFNRLGDLINTPKESEQIDNEDILLPKIKGSIQFVDVNFKFPNTDNFVISNLNLKIEPNSFIAIIGKSGSGKSTFLKLISRLYLPDSGKILVDNLDINKVELNSLRGQIGFVPQESVLFSGSIKENITLAAPESNMDEIIRAAKIADAHNFIMSLDKGYSTFVGERGVLLSGGQRQRIAIARALISNPKILLMDEATSALDYPTEKNIYNNLFENLNSSTIFLITHRISNIRHAKKIIVMHEGQIAELGTHEELYNLKGRYFSLLNNHKDEIG